MKQTEVPLISSMQKLLLYETKARIYVVGSNNDETKFRILKIHRNEPRDLIMEDDMKVYTADEVRNTLAMIESGNRPLSSILKGGSGLYKSESAFGIAGFVRFLEGYYMILITKRRRVALIGPHTIYKVEDTCMIYIPNVGNNHIHSDESRYVKMFQNVDLSSNFYFSYSYDLTHSLQYNMAPTNSPSSKDSSRNSDANSYLFVNRGQFPKPSTPYILPEDCVLGVKNTASSKFVWNSHLQQPCKDMIHSDWVINIIHGFIGQVNICIFGKPIYLTLIGRRSNQFAGTRFLKRGANNKGAVANEVETEQIVHDASVTFLNSACVSSFVQLRGSIPLFWSQDISKMVPKPQIVVDQADPYGFVAGQHFNDVIKRFGAPIIVLNLVKRREKRRHESILTKEFISAIEYLNQFLAYSHNIQYIGFDMAGVSKKKDCSVMDRLGKIAKSCIKRTGFYFHSPSNVHDELWMSEPLKGIRGVKTEYGKRQTGVVRTNCVDCLDRTNTAQFAVGKCALGYQLYAMGVNSSPNLEYDTDCVRMLEKLYEDQGNTLALQYGGSQLVHRIKGYRKIATWTYNSRDLVQTISRYYSNAFSDAEKQQSINLFLGVYSPNPRSPNLWELSTDYYLHNPDSIGKKLLSRKSYCQWWDPNVPYYLPLALDEEEKGMNDQVHVSVNKRTEECVNEFSEYYHPYELTSLEELFAFTLTHSIRNVMPKHAIDYSPFSIRINLERPIDDQSLEASINNKSEPANSSSIIGSGSTGGGGGTDAGNRVGGGEDSMSSSESDEVDGDVDFSDDSNSDNSSIDNKQISFKDVFPTTKQVYDFQTNQPTKQGLCIYERYAQFGDCWSKPPSINDKNTRKITDQLWEMSAFKLDSVYQVELPPVNKMSDQIYTSYVLCGKHGAGPPKVKDMETYQRYLYCKYR
ncbi:polyphosphoinositide phosphatase-like [Argonauta hians]